MTNFTASQFLKNPTGKGSATVARRDRIILDMRTRFSYLYKKNRKSFKLKIFLYQDKYYFYFQIPSEDYFKENLSYDVIIEFRPPNERAAKAKDLNNYLIRFISNSPNFMFTYGYLYNKDDLLISWLSYKLGPKALNQPPEVRNPRLEYGFEKSVYFALLYLETNPKALKNPLHLTLPNRQRIKSSFKSSELKLREYNKIKKQKNASKKNSSGIKRQISNRVDKRNEEKKRVTKPINRKVKSIGKVKKVKKTNSTKRK
ncbi:hypothetical protein UFVDC4_00087 [Staphylococcus phage vB_SauM-UFV_DC4]|nr:hypothetical protein UFVDC4_00087 [Staphylococcus phage vB_SauM-UFV_DC4]